MVSIIFEIGSTTIMSKKYSLKEKLSSKVDKELNEYLPLTRQLLFNRGVDNKKKAEGFLNPDFERHLYDPFLLTDMDKAVKRILKAIDKNEKIAIWSDYDADGIPGGALLHNFFKLIDFNNFINYIPNRHTEGYGLNSEGVREIANQKTKLLITVDCGIRNHKEIEEANKLGMEIIVTDHHEQSDKLPKAFAVINPKRTDSKYPEQILCGSGVVWKLIEAILSKKRDLLKIGQEKWLLDLVGLATLSDMVPLTGENRVLAYFGLKVLRKTRREGLKSLYSKLRLKRNNLAEDDITFLITPRINAASRMGHPKDAFDLLVAETETEGEEIAKHLDKINNERKVVVALMVKEIKKIVKDKFIADGEKPLIVVGNPKWQPALLGLAANSIVGEFNRPVFLWGRGEGSVLKGSCRSEGSTDLVALMERTGGAFSEFGGHKFSGGFSVDFDKVHTLEKDLIKASTHKVSNNPEILIDAELNISEVNFETVSEINKLGPFGVGNQKPLFIFHNVVPEKISTFGKNGEHLSVEIKNGLKKIKAISFFVSADKFGEALLEGKTTNMVANMELSYFNFKGGGPEVRLRIVDFFTP